MLAYNELKYDREDGFNIRFELIRSQYDVFKKYFASIENIITTVTAETIMEMDHSDLENLETALDIFSKKIAFFEKDLKTPAELQARLECLWKEDRVRKNQIKYDLSIIVRGYNKLQFFLNRIATMKKAIAESRALAYKSPTEKPPAVVVQRKSSIAEPDCPLVLLKEETPRKDEKAKETTKLKINDNQAKLDADIKQASKDVERDRKAVLDIVKQDIYKEIDKYIDSTIWPNFYGRRRARQLKKIIEDCTTLPKLKDKLQDFLLKGKTESDSHGYNRFFSPTLTSSLEGGSLQARLAILFDCLLVIKDVKRYKKNSKDKKSHFYVHSEQKALVDLSNKITRKFDTISKSK